MRLSTKLALAATVAAVSAVPAAPADAQIICFNGPHWMGEVCTDDIGPIVANRKACVDGYVAAGTPADAVNCVPRTIILP